MLKKGDVFSFDGEYVVNAPLIMPKLGDVLPITMEGEEYARAVVTHSDEHGCTLTVIDPEPVSSETP